MRYRATVTFKISYDSKISRFHDLGFEQCLYEFFTYLVHKITFNICEKFP